MRILIGGSPCTKWSIAQTRQRETTAEGIGWELFLNYRIARDKYKPDYFLYENNKSMSNAIREQITAELGVEPVLINSALVSAQNRWRLYWVGKRNPDGTYSKVEVEQPEDLGIFVRDILETKHPQGKKGYALVTDTEDDDSICVAQRGRYIGTDGKTEQHLEPRADGKTNTLTTVGKDNMVCTPVRIGTIENAAKNRSHDSQQYRVYSPDGKAVTLCGNGGGVGAKTGLYATPVAGRVVGRRVNAHGHRDDYNENLPHIQRFEVNEDPRKTNCLTTVSKDNMIAVACCMRYERSPEAKRLRKQYEAHEIKHGFHEFSELHPRIDGKTNTLSTVLKDNPICVPVTGADESSNCAISASTDKKYPVYKVVGGLIKMGGRQYPIKLADGFYIVRNLTVGECMRLQTVPDTYTFPVSDSQAYKMLGNGWTVDVIAHIMSHFTGLTEEPVEVLSMYDGMSCGHIALDKLGAEITAYYATEIDKYAMQTTQHNYPDTVQLGDAFQVLREDWTL